MTLSLWRFTHLSLAFIASLFLIIASVTGIILAFDAAQETTLPYKTENFSSATLDRVIPVLKENYSEITVISVDDNGFVLLEGSDNEGNSVKGFVNTSTGKIIGKPIVKSEFIDWATQLHRSLFLKETGRFMVGLVSVLLVIMSISGFALILKRQKNLKNIFSKIQYEYFSQYFHVVAGRALLFPILLVTLTASYLFLARFELIKPTKPEFITNKIHLSKEIKPAEFPIFKNTKLSEVKKIEFPFIEGEPDEFYNIKLKDKNISINQITGEVVTTEKTPWVKVYEEISLVLHTGKGNFILAILLGITSLAMLGFIYSGFTIFLKRNMNKFKNYYPPKEAEIILLVGTENGSTLGFANNVHQQLISQNKKSCIVEINQYQTFPKAQYFIIMTSTYGLGDAPSNASHFEKLLEKHPQNKDIKISIVGFGSTNYDDYCAFAEVIQQKIAEKKWANLITPLHKINDKSTQEIANWAKDWSMQTTISLASSPSLYLQKISHLKKFRVIGRSKITDETTTFILQLEPVSNTDFQSGDLLTIFPKNDNTERHYSVGKVEGKVQLLVKLHENGLGSGYLYQLKKGDILKAKLLRNNEFHFPKNAKKVAMIANGTGIAPFLGMIDENKNNIETTLYCGFRKNNLLSQSFQQFADKNIEKNQLKHLHFAFSREENPQYVMDLVMKNTDYFTEIIQNQQVIMICGALKMQQDVEKILSEICETKNLDWEQYKNLGLLKTDCY